MEGPVNGTPICTDDGFAVNGEAGVANDLTKYHSYFAWLSNHVTVRSDVYVAYITVLAGTVESSGTVTGSASTTMLTDTNKNWASNQWATLLVAITSGPGAGQIARITGNTPNSITFTANPPWQTTPNNTSTYQILPVVRRFVSVIDRSNCCTPADRPHVLMFSELR